jgi:hypothetical protein
MGKALRADALAQMTDGLRVAEELLKAHDLSLEHRRVIEFRRKANRTMIVQQK